MTRLAWFSPMPPVPSGIARCSADLIDRLRSEFDIDLFVDEPVARIAPGTESAHAFVWRHHRRPYDLTVHQLGNSSFHDYQWPYLFRYPGLTVLHDAHLHHARAAALLRTGRATDYRSEFARNHPDAPADAAELVVAGFDNHAYYAWPMTRLVAERSRMVAVHTEPLARQLREAAPDAQIEIVRLGHGRLLSTDDRARLRHRCRIRYGIPAQAPVFGCFGGLSPEKRLPQILEALAGVLPYAPDAHLLLAGAPSSHDLAGAPSSQHALRREIAARGLASRTTVTGYLETDDELTACIAACDVGLALRWPTAREVSGPWLRCLAAGIPTVVIDLAHQWDVPSFDPRTWQTRLPAPPRAVTTPPITVAIDILDEVHSLRLAMRRLVTDPAFAEALGRAGRAHWIARHSIEGMAGDYRRVIARALARPVPATALPGHLLDAADRMLLGELRRFGLPPPVDTRRSGDVAFEVDS